jgi:phosphate transport system protein
MSEHIVTSYESQLQNLNNTIIKMGALAESQFADSVMALQKNNPDLVDRIIGKDERLDDFEKKLESLVIDLIALRQPLAIDLRETVSSMKISSELERVGDLSKNIAKRSLALKLPIENTILKDLKNCAELVQKNLKLAMDAYSKRSAESALEVWIKDQNIDNVISALMEEILKFMKLNKKNLEDGTHLLFVAKNIERIGDHATNIVEQIYFLIRGSQIKGERPKGQESIARTK